MNKLNFKSLNILLLAIVCAGSVLLLLPTINNNVGDPNMITYFNHDEGFQMDLVWCYFTGEKRDSYYMDVDYGVELLYISDLARFVLSRFIDFTPGTFILLIRWFHMISWVVALIALWYFVGYHFQRGWQQIVVVLLMVTRPAFAYFSNSLKPEPLVLLFMILGFTYIMKMLENPTFKNLTLSVLCASVAFMIKFSGVFLLPAIVAAMFFAQEAHKETKKEVFPRLKLSWILELLIGISLILLPFLFIFYYVRKTTGLTYYQEFGLMQSFLNNKGAILILGVGLISMIISLALFFLRNNTNKFINEINKINSYIFIVTGLFLGFSLVIGLRWIFNPQHFIATYSFNFFDFTGMLAHQSASAGSYIETFISKCLSFDIILLLLLGFYLIMELRFRTQNLAKYKRLTLLIFLAPCFLSMISQGRFKQHHMLPFIMAGCILAVEGVSMFMRYKAKTNE